MSDVAGKPFRNPSIWVKKAIGASCVAAMTCAYVPAHGQPEVATGDQRGTRSITIDTREGTWMSVDVGPQGQRLVFDVLGDVYSKPIGAERAKRLTHTTVGPGGDGAASAYDGQPRLSPDGDRIAFVSDRSGSDNVWIMDADGSNPRQVTHAQGVVFSSPSWSPNGQRLLVARSEDARSYAIWSYRADGEALGANGGRELLGPDRQVDFRGPVFGPEGRYIYVSTPFDSSADRPLRRQTWQIGRFDRQTGELTRVTDRDGGAVRPALSPQGRRMTYATWHDGSPALAIRNLATGEERIVVDGVSRNLQDMYLSQLGLFPGYSVSPDGEAVYLSNHGRLRRISLATGEESRIPMRIRTELTLPERPSANSSIPTGYSSRMIRWPVTDSDRDRVYFEAAGRIWRQSLRSAANPTAHPVTPRSMTAYQPALSPTGQTLAFVGTRGSGNDQHVFALDVDSGEITALTEESGDYARPVWTPAGDRLLVVIERGDPSELARQRPPKRQLAWLDKNGGPVAPFATVRIGDAGVTFSADGERLWYTANSQLRSLRTDGTEHRSHTRVPGARRIVPSPNGRYVAISAGNRVLVASKAQLERKARDSEQQRGGLGDVSAMERHSHPAGYFPRWTEEGQLMQTFGGQLIHRSVDKETDAQWLQAPVTKRDDIDAVYHPVKPDTSDVLALKGGRLVTMGAPGVIERGTLVIEGARITRVGPQDEVAIPESARVLDVSGQTLIPGLIDVHQHALFLQGESALQNPQAPFPPASALLAFGITSTRDPALLSNLRDFSMIELINSGRIPGPRYFTTGERIRPSEYPIKNETGAAEAIDLQQRLGASYIKEYLQPRRRQRQWLVDSAFAGDIAITSDTGFSYKRGVTAILDGYTGTEHSAGNVPIYDDFAQLVSRSKTFYTPTVLSQIGAEYYYERHDIVHHDKLRRYLPEHLLKRLDERTLRGHGVPLSETAFPTLTRNLDRLVNAGAIIGVGAHDQPAPTGLGTHWEIRSFVEGGLTPRQALEAATVNGARILGIHDQVGSLTTGKLADLLVLDKNPLDDIEHTEAIDRVLQNGIVYDAQTLDRLWPTSPTSGSDGVRGDH